MWRAQSAAKRVQATQRLLTTNQNGTGMVKNKNIGTDYKQGNLLCAEGRVYNFRTYRIPAYIAWRFSIGCLKKINNFSWKLRNTLKLCVRRYHLE